MKDLWKLFVDSGAFYDIQRICRSSYLHRLAQ